MKQQLLLFLFFGLLILNSCTGDGKSNATTATHPQTSNININNTNLSVYTHRYLVSDVALFENFEKQANKKVDIYLSSGAKILELAKKGQLKGDVVILQDLYQAHQLKKMGLIEPFHAGTFDEMVPSKYIDNEGYWAGLSRWTMSNVYRIKKADALQMRNYAGILDPQFKGRVVTPHPDSSGLVTFVASMLAAHGKDATSTYLRLLNKNLVGPPSGSDYDAMQVVLTGKADIAFMSGSAYMRFRNSGNIDLYRKTNALAIEVPVDAKENNYFNITPICILKNPPNRNYDIPLIEFLTKKDNQNTYTEAMMEYPVNIFSDVVYFLDEIFHLPQGIITMEDTENQLDTARELIRTIMGV